LKKGVEDEFDLEEAVDVCKFTLDLFKERQRQIA
jgi:hypothetical protein